MVRNCIKQALKRRLKASVKYRIYLKMWPKFLPFWTLHDLPAELAGLSVNQLSA